MRLAFSTISCPGYTPAEIAQAVRAYGYDGVELYALAGERLTPSMLADCLADVQRGLSGVPIASLNSWARLSADNTDERTGQVRQVVAAMELAVELNCPIVKVFGGEFPPDQAPDTVVAYIAEAIEHLGRRGRELGVRLAVETHDGLSRGETLRAVLDQVTERQYVGALWDVHHPYRHGEAVQRTDDLIGARVIHAHVKDAVRRDASWEFCRLGDGELPVEAMLRALAARDFTGYVAIDWEKMWHPEIEDPETILPQYAQTLRTYLARTTG